MARCVQGRGLCAQRSAPAAAESVMRGRERERVGWGDLLGLIVRPQGQVGEQAQLSEGAALGDLRCHALAMCMHAHT